MICNNCGRAFDRPATAYQMHYEVDTLGERAYPICPYCSSEEIEDSDTCPVCGNEKQTAEDYCNDCQASIHEDVSSFIKELCERFQIDRSTAAEWINYDIERRL